MITLRNIHTDFVFEIDDEAGAELLRTNKLSLEIVKATKKALKKVEKAEIPTEEQLLLGEEAAETPLEEKFKDVEIVEEAAETPKQKTSTKKMK